ncbi:hypothetical protein BpHYR1_019005 [Brachionus plicatilis]|uniref:Uncharacterized protein n=1 Tax=Brachionus plicatilis TaxID=10195 RepID=A0A3M7RRA5_BRAPC|nr:hypothetical protein BpHYR1_019005 [Brachionus plicatilis]
MLELVLMCIRTRFKFFYLDLSKLAQQTLILGIYLENSRKIFSGFERKMPDDPYLKNDPTKKMTFSRKRNFIIL